MESRMAVLLLSVISKSTTNEWLTGKEYFQIFWPLKSEEEGEFREIWEEEFKFWSGKPLIVKMKDRGKAKIPLEKVPGYLQSKIGGD